MKQKLYICAMALLANNAFGASNSAHQQRLEDVLSTQEFSGHVYSPEFFQMRLKEEMLRTNRTHEPFLFLKIPTKHFDIFGLELRSNPSVKAWEIAVLTIMSQSKVIDIKGYLEDDAGLGLIFLNVNAGYVQTLKKEILRNLRDAGLLDKIRLKPASPLFQVLFYSGEVEKDRVGTEQAMESFSHINEGFFSVRQLHYSDLQHNRWNHILVNLGKRALDIGASLVGILALSPLLLFLAAAVKISDPKGPVIFHQRRVGLNGKLFTMLKFRSMYVDAEERLKEIRAANEVSGPVFKMKNDPRIFPLGRIIRKYSLDELPQLLNVLFGQMAIVGPRPPIPEEVMEYLPWHKMRLSVKPGLTCHWQVSGRSDIGFDDWMRLDNKYVRHGNLRTDMKLIGKTFSAVMKGDGAY